VKDNPLLSKLGGREEWERFLAQVRESKLTVGIWLMSGEVAGVEDGKLLLAFSPQQRFAMAMIAQANNRRLVEEHLEKFYGRKFTVETCELSDLGGRKPDRQAEMEIKARTMPAESRAAGPDGKAAGRDGEAATADSPGADGPVVKGDPGKGAGKKGRSTGGRGRRKKVTNPDLQRIMESLDAELLD
jgi:hypothetical protein